MAAPRPKKTVVKKKPPVKKTPKIVFREVAPEPKKKIVFKTTKDDSPKKSQPAKDVKSGGLRAQHLQEAKNEYNTSRNNRLLDLENKNKEVRRRNKITKFRIKSLDTKINDLKKVKPTASAGSKALALLGKVAKVSGIVGAITSPITSAVPAGTGSTVPGQAQKAVEKKMKREIRQGPKLAVTGVKEGTTRRLAPTGSRKPAPGTNYSGQEKKIPRKPAPGTNYSGQAKSTYSGYGDFKTPRVQSSSSNTAATTAASSGSNGGGSQAANVAKAGGKAKAKVGRQTRYQRNELAMEQRKRSSSKPKKSIFSLFRKG